MKFARLMHVLGRGGICVAAAAFLLAPAAANADGVVFQKPNRQKQTPAASSRGVEFRRAAAPAEPTPQEAEPASPPAKSPAKAAPNPLRESSAAAAPSSGAPQQASYNDEALPIAAAPRPAASRVARRTPSFAEPGQDLSGPGATRRSRAIAAASVEPWQGETDGVTQASYCTCGQSTCPLCEPGCAFVEPGCAYVEPGCAYVEPGCGLMEPACGVVDPGCGLVEPECGLIEPTCGCGEPDCGIVGCGSCVGNPGPDFWCFPVCLPRFKDLRFWGGVHGFKGPRDAPFNGGAGDGNFGFQEGVNIGGRAPLVSLAFPQLSYQLGYQAVQSQLSGLSDGRSDDRSQNFVTAGVFRRVPAGVQFGVVWDWMDDDFIADADLNQIRYEISLKSKLGREFGFWGASATNDATVGAITYETVDQYALFFRCHFREGGAIRLWGGATGDNEGLVGADIIAPLNNRWSVNSGFNYLITDEPNGAVGAREESWNVGINLVWHYGCMAKRGNTNPHAPLFSTADNGWMFIDRVQ
jgi:hypothetical protein